MNITGYRLSILHYASNQTTVPNHKLSTGNLLNPLTPTPVHRVTITSALDQDLPSPTPNTHQHTPNSKHHRHNYRRRPCNSLIPTCGIRGRPPPDFGP